MKPTRRDFLKTSMAATAAALTGARAVGSDVVPAHPQEFYELKSYRFKPGAPSAPLHGYLQDALLPALATLGVGPVGVFTEIVVDQKAVTAVPKPDSPVWTLIAYQDLNTYVSVNADLNANPTVQEAGAAYLQAPKTSPAFDRIDSWLLRAFAGLPKCEVPSFSKTKVATRVFELRTYESHSELKALGKMAMFNNGEIELMKDLGMAPVFFGQALAGSNLPHLSYITSGPDLATHLGNWKKFGPDPRWIAMKDLPQYADTVSANVARFLVPTAYSGL